MKVKFPSIKSLFSKSTQALGKLTTPDFWTQAYYGYSTHNTLYNHVTHGYAENPYLYSVLSRIAQAISRLDYSIVKNGKPVTSGDLFKLWSKPNDIQKTQQFIEEIALNALTGEVFLLNEIAVGFENRVVSLKVLKNKFVEIILDGNENVRAYRYTERGKTYDYEPERVYHIQLSNIVYNEGERAHRGFSPLEPLRNVYTASNNIVEAEAAIFKNRGITGILTNDSDVPMLPKEMESIDEDWQRRTTGAGQFGKIKVTNSKLRYLELGMSPKDLQLTGTNIDKLRTICNVYNVDSSLFNDPANKTYSNRSEAQKAFYTDCVIPWAEFILNNLNAYFYEKFKTDEKVIFDKSKIEVLKEVNRTLTDNVIAQLNAQLIGINEAQTILGLPITENSEAATTLNGAQVTSLITLLQSTTGEMGLPPDVIAPVIRAAFPSIPENIISDIVAGLKKKP